MTQPAQISGHEVPRPFCLTCQRFVGKGGINWRSGKHSCGGLIEYRNNAAHVEAAQPQEVPAFKTALDEARAKDVLTEPIDLESQEVPTEQRANLSVTVRDGVWLNFRDKDGGQAALDMEELASKRSGVVGMVIMNWCREKRETKAAAQPMELPQNTRRTLAEKAADSMSEFERGFSHDAPAQPQEVPAEHPTMEEFMAPFAHKGPAEQRAVPVQVVHSHKYGSAQPASAAKPPEDGLEEKVRRWLADNFNDTNINHAFSLADFIRTQQAARERELREKLEGMADDWKARGKGGSEAELRALLASHWPAKKE